MAVEAGNDATKPSLLFADVADNAGGGGRANTVWILKAFHDADVKGCTLAIFYDPALAAERLTGAALELRTADYAIRTADTAIVSTLPVIPEDFNVVLALPQQVPSDGAGWPRTVFVVVKAPDSEETEAQPAIGLMLSQASARENYKVESFLTLQSDIPEVAELNLYFSMVTPMTWLERVPTYKEQRAQMNKPSHHPIPEGKMGCSDCHSAHGSVGPKLMKRDSVVETCYGCHMEKRGPFVHNHEPVSEDCSNCHNPHGTTVENMLKVRAPFLCHQCHTPHGGFIPQLLGAQATAPSATMTGKQTTNLTQGRSCLNCHTQVHGTNNPTRTNPTPQFNFR